MTPQALPAGPASPIHVTAMARTVKHLPRGVSRMADSAHTVLVNFDRPVTDDLLRDLHETLTRELPARLALQAAAAGQVAQLSDIELSTCQLMAKGLSSRETGERLHRSTKAVELARSRAYAKLGVDTAVECAVLLAHAGVV